MQKQLEKFIQSQLSQWPMAAENFRALKVAQIREVEVGGLKTLLQYNPSRIRSSNADISEKAISERPCFLCEKNKPAEQKHIEFEGRKGRKYHVCINPYPIFPAHLVISSANHTPQTIRRRFVDMLDLAAKYQSSSISYNGPYSGASAPDHMHFQAFPKGSTPLEVDIDGIMNNGLEYEDSTFEYLTNVQEARLYHYKKFARGIFALRGKTSKSIAKLFYRLLDCADIMEGESEVRFNCMTWFSKGEYRSVVILRGEHRSHHYYSKGEDHLTMSPGLADVAGFFVIPSYEDFQKLNSQLLSEVMDEVAINREGEAKVVSRLTRTQPKLSVGIMSGEEITFEIISDGAGQQTVRFQEGKINYNGALYDQLVFEANTMSTQFAEPTFILYGVTIGVDFHWQRKVTQKFAGTLKFIVENHKITAVNVIGVEDYLLSVISSEMKSSATLEFLKAHSVISRSWVMSQIANKNKKHEITGPALDNVPELVTYLDSSTAASTPTAIKAAGTPQFIKWFDHDDHKNFDVCADDHCQRYQGLTMAAGDTVRKAIDQTWGLVLMSDGEICDARFSKSCGGMMEEFSACWEDKDYSYLKGISDTKEESTKPDLTKEEEAEKWILSSPESFCNTQDNAILSQVLNDYDLETKDFYRWQTRYPRDEVSELYARRSSMDLGKIVAMVPVERAVSARLKRLEVIGEKGSIIIGKELIIRRYFSESHLKSSAFIVKYYDADDKEIPESKVLSDWNDSKTVSWDHIILYGAGWGHGVGLCQIGAAVMSFKGYKFDEILAHYYPGSELKVIE
ncbi:MAG: DUF4922 domain-containing protein [Bacteroidales bacterium]|nr:DUF4922 domain-containing protein [Bacteroidales bacterium]